MANQQMLQQQYGQYQEGLDQYGKKVNEFNFAADVYNRQAKEYQGVVDAYNNLPQVQAYKAAVDNYNNNLLPQYNNVTRPQYDAAAQAYNSKVNTWQNGSVTVSIPLLGNRTSSPERLYNSLVSYSGDPAQTQAQRDYLINNFYPGAAPSMPAAPTQPTLAADIAAKKPGEFTAKKPELTAVAPKDPGFTSQQMRQIEGQQTLAQQEAQGAGEPGLVQRAQGRKAPADSIIGGLLQNVRYST